MANDYLQVYNTECRNQTRYVTATPKTNSNKTALDVNICNADEINGGGASAEPCIQTITPQDLSITTSATQVSLTSAERTYIKITNMSEFYPVFYSQSATGPADVLLPCSVITICMNTTVNSDLFIKTESGDARIIVSQSDV